MLMGLENQNDVMLVVKTTRNGTAQVLTRFGIVWIVSLFIHVTE
jgi:hypothetical protein